MNESIFCLEHLATGKEPEDVTEKAISNNYHINNNIVVSCQLITLTISVVNVNKRYMSL